MDVFLDGEAEDEGEIVIAGPQLADGYVEAEDLTQRQFRTVLRQGRPVRAYFTGDWAERRDGCLYFINRIDRQVKLHGHRIEPGQIDAALREAGCLAAASVVIEQKIISFVEKPLHLDAELLLERVSAKVPRYMIPSAVHTVDRLPLNRNDKVDFLRLEEMARDLYGVGS
jgi:D-alanine--poly(phosphoribitol) ligase subunit 1